MRKGGGSWLTVLRAGGRVELYWAAWESSPAQEGGPSEAISPALKISAKVKRSIRGKQFLFLISTLLHLHNLC